MAEYNRLTSQHNFYKAGLQDGIEKRKKRTELQKEKKTNQQKQLKKMLNMGFTLEQILEATNLSKEEIEKLK